jgi:hypothetical protein
MPGMMSVYRQEIILVTAIHRKPANHEVYLQFWKQHYQQEQTSFTQVKSEVNAQENLWQLNIPSKGINVIYDENSDRVTRVIYYAVE